MKTKRLVARDVYPNLKVEEEAARIALKAIKDGTATDVVQAFNDALRQVGHPAITDRA